MHIVSDIEFNALMEKAATSYASGLCVKVEVFEVMLEKEINV